MVLQYGVGDWFKISNAIYEKALVENEKGNILASYDLNSWSPKECWLRWS